MSEEKPVNEDVLENEAVEKQEETQDEGVVLEAVSDDEVVDALDEVSVEALEQMQQKVSELEDQLASKEEDLLRMAAEMQNLQRRMQRDIDNTRKFSNDKIIKALIPVLDSFDKAVEVIGDDACEVTVDAMVEGTQNTMKIFTKVLEDHGIEIIDPVGEKFDPEKHEAMSMVPSPDHEKNTVINVFQKGYLLNDRVVRAAMVVVSS